MALPGDGRGAEMSEDHNSTTQFEVALPGGTKVNLLTKRAEVFIWIAITAALVFNGLTTWQLLVKVDILTLSVQAQARGIREAVCLASQVEPQACRKMGEMQ